MIKATKFLLTLNSDIKDSFKKFSLLFRQAEMVFIIIWFLDHFTLKYVPSMNSIWIITPTSLLDVWVTKFKTFFTFFKLPILTSNNVIRVNLFAIFFDKAQHVVKISTRGYVSVFYEVINLFIKLENFMLMFLISKLKGFYLTVTVCDVSLMPFLHFVCKLLPNLWEYHIAAVSSEVFVFGCWLPNTSSYIPSSLV